MTKVVLQHVSDGEKKVFVEVSLIILVAVLSFVGMRMQSTQVDLTDRFMTDSLGFSVFFLDRFCYQKILIFWIGCSLWLADFPFFSI